MTEFESKLVEECLAKLGEHFEAVQILCSDYEHDGTEVVRRGIGNWYARQGMAHEFITLQQAADIAEQIHLRKDIDND